MKNKKALSLMLTMSMLMNPVIAVNATEIGTESTTAITSATTETSNEVSSPELNIDQGDMKLENNLTDAVDGQNQTITSSNWLQNALEKGNFSVDVSQFNLFEMPSDMDNLSSQYSSLLSEMETEGYGKRSELEVKKNEGYTINAQSAFNDIYGDLFKDGLKLKKTTIPKSFNVNKMMKSASKERKESYKDVINSKSFKNIKENVGVSKATSATTSKKKTSSKQTINNLYKSLGVDKSSVLKEAAGFSSMKNQYKSKKVDTSAYNKAKAKYNQKTTKSSKSISDTVGNAFSKAKDAVKKAMNSK